MVLFFLCNMHDLYIFVLPFRTGWDLQDNIDGNGASKHLSLFTLLGEEVFKYPTSKCGIIFLDAFHKKSPASPSWQRSFVLKSWWLLDFIRGNFFFCIYWYSDIAFLLCSVNVASDINIFWNVKATLHSWNNPT